MKIILSKQVFRGPAGTTSLTLMDRLLSYLRFSLNRSGLSPAEAGMVTAAFSEELAPLFHGKFRSKEWLFRYAQHELLRLGVDQRKASALVADLRKGLDMSRPLDDVLLSVGKWVQKLATDGTIRQEDVAGVASSLSDSLGSDLRDLTDEERGAVATRAKSILKRIPKPLPDKVLSRIGSFVGIIDDYSKGETQESDPATGAKGIRPEITMMMALSDLVDDSDELSIRLAEMDPKERVRTEKGEKPRGPGWYKVLATRTKDGKPEEDWFLNIYVQRRDPKEIEKALNDSVGKIRASKSRGRAEGKGEWVRAIREDPMESLATRRQIPEPRYSRSFHQAQEAVSGAAERIGELREEILRLVRKFPAADLSLPANALLDVVNELSQSAEALGQASLGRETIDLGQFEARAAALGVPLRAEARGIDQGLRDAKAVLLALVAELGKLLPKDGRAERPTALVPIDDQGDMEKRLLGWEISLAAGIANRGVRSIDEVLGDGTFWHQFAAVTQESPA